VAASVRDLALGKTCEQIAQSRYVDASLAVIEPVTFACSSVRGASLALQRETPEGQTDYACDISAVRAPQCRRGSQGDHEGDGDADRERSGGEG